MAADGAVNMLYPCLSVAALQTLCFTFCQFKKDNSYIDVMWSLSFLLPNYMIIGAKMALNQPIDGRTWAINACLTLWAVRLAYHIGKRHTGEDYRYVSLRERMSTRGQCCYYVNAFLLIFMLQAGLSLAVNYTVMKVTAVSSLQTYAAATAVGTSQSLLWTDYVGFGLFACGFLFEVVGDA